MVFKYNQKNSLTLNKLKILISTIVILSIPILLTGQQNSGKYEKDWTIVESWELDVSGQASGLATDGTYFYFGIYGVDGDKIYKFDPADGSTVLLFSAPQLEDAFGLTFDGEHLWATDHANSSSLPAYAMQFDLSGNLLQQFDLPDHYMSGIAYDNGDFWVATYYPDPGTIYNIDNAGAIISEFQAPGEQTWDLCRENDHIWVADYNDDMIYKTDLAGNLIESHESENIQPSGITYDGQYLWFVDGAGGTSKIYKVDLEGGGTPQISVPVTEYNYGTVALGDSATWNCLVNNTGTADLVIENLIIQNAVPVFVYIPIPQTIEPGGSLEIPFVYKPQDPIPLNTIVTVESSDPVTPEVELELTGAGVFAGPHINVLFTSHDYGDIRMNATKRWFLQIENDGNESLEIENIVIDSPSFYVDENIEFPLEISVLEVKDIGIWFWPDLAGDFEASAVITHDDPTQDPITITLLGSAFDQDYPIGEPFWNYIINTSWDNSIKAINPIPDVTGDGIHDVIVGSEDYFVRCFNGNASGLTEVIWEYEAGSVYNQNDLVIIEDIDDDAYRDVIMGKTGIGAIRALSGKTGDLIWTFNTQQYGDGGWVYQVWTGYDYNDDGVDDVLAATGGLPTGSRRIFCIDGLTGSEIWANFTNGPNFSVIGVDDFTGDGKPDVIGGASNTNETEGKIYGMNGTNGGIEWTYTTSGSSVWALMQVEDINDDDIRDIAAGDFGGQYYLIDVTTGNPIESGSVGSALIIRFEKLDDVNGNGHPDIVVSKSGSIAVVFDGFSGDQIWAVSLNDQSWNVGRINDVNGDGINDVIIGTLYNNNYCYFLDGTNGATIHSLNFFEAVDGIRAIPDINGDGSMEMVAGGRDGKIYCYSGGLNSTALVADFSADPTTGILPLDVQFTDLSIGANQWEWDFDYDGTIDSYDQNPQYTYTEEGVYTVSLTVGNGSQTDTHIKPDYINVLLTETVEHDINSYEINISPNPSDGWVDISYKLNERSIVSIEIIDLQGNKIIDLKNGEVQNKGTHSVSWEGKDSLGSITDNGIYLCRLSINGKVISLKMVRK
jgi:PKD repeat protein/glutamine cyclotransferase